MWKETERQDRAINKKNKCDQEQKIKVWLIKDSRDKVNASWPTRVVGEL
jgi:hypothetical protein